MADWSSEERFDDRSSADRSSASAPDVRELIERLEDEVAFALGQLGEEGAAPAVGRDEGPPAVGRDFGWRDDDRTEGVFKSFHP